ncbi:hypothetical protein EUTSA_v10028666mg [Eutrema salsugineum]|uniref:FBD domain-containing protein n=1 Tax=Eutrema salsugineum TaxID=72664 RepID=V4MZN4_EUTSA|nr:FBD-associated F-box protein At4g10400 [Eutrema salsugineum]XP_024010513.1 FBD-associated F-box protein At4g10400 [Eutrema salsugineum]XP_024010514.1 FBD-associated F-box protein At4g10400 [Eutrema salsugineum]ESQ38101.1 hypothetical protein EUTSA_v10028666mg [Eutrema salsugineum]
MDRISDLSDELLIKILTSVPTKLAVSTSVLSKRWECLWKWLPKLEYDDTGYSVSECERLQCFLDKNLPLHRAVVIESFRLQFKNKRFKPEVIKLWLLFAVSRCPRELEVSYSYSYPRKRNISLSSLYTCKSLVILKLSGAILVEVPRMVSLPSLKKLELRKVTYSEEQSLHRLLSICPVLEDLSVELRDSDKFAKLAFSIPSLSLELDNGYKMRQLVISVRSLQSLTLSVPCECSGVDEVVIDTPSLKYLKLDDRFEGGRNCMVGNMPELREAHLDVCYPGRDIVDLLVSITSVKRLTISSHPYGDGFVFNQLEHLKLCVDKSYSLDLLVQLLKDSPNLQVLDLYDMEDDYHFSDDYLTWDQPSTVPECMLSSLRIFNWSEYFGRRGERDVAVYVLENARLLETATISSNDMFVPKLGMIKELSLSSRASTTCRLVFN